MGFRRDGFDVSAEEIGIETSGALTATSTLHAGATGGRTGRVSFHDDRIEAPELFFEQLTLHQFAFESPDYRVTLPETGGEVQLNQVSAALTVELDPEADSMTPTRIVIHTVHVPTLSAAGLVFVMKAVDIGGTPGDITIRLPESPPASATDLTLGASTPLGVGFVLPPRFNVP